MSWLRLPDRAASTYESSGIKPKELLPIYEKHFESLREEEFVLLELGVNEGHSLEMWRDAFPKAIVVGIDLKLPDLDLGERVHMIEGDQLDCALLAEVRRAFAPQGFSVIVDDCSHLAKASAASIRCLFDDHLKPQGHYVIEDWLVGYLDWFDDGRSPDASYFDESGVGRTARSFGQGVRLPSHDFGLAGLAKQLIDQLAHQQIQYWMPSHGPDADSMNVQSISIEGSLLVLQKGSRPTS